MRFSRSLTALLGLAIVALPIAAGIKAMTLPELMEITKDTVHVQILDRSTERTVMGGEEVVLTKLTVAGQSLRSREPWTQDVVFFGSHDASDGYMLSEMPTLQDTRVGNEVIVFVDNDERIPEAGIAYNLAYIYRVESVFGTKVVLGKGEGAAFAKNVKLVDASNQVRELHVALEAAKQANDAVNGNGN